MKTILSLVLAIFSIQTDLQTLDNELQQSETYCAQHEQTIDSLRQSYLQDTTSFSTCLALYECYASYQFDSALLYVDRLETLANCSNDTNQIATAQIKKAFVYFSAGLFKESDDVLAQLDITSCDSAIQRLYYTTYARLCLDLGSYASGRFYKPYTDRGINLLDAELELLSPLDTVNYNYAMALKAMKQGDYRLSLRHYEDCLLATDIPEHMRAIIYSSMSYPASMCGDADLALHYMILAAISDVKAAIHEAVALRFVATMLHERGDSDNAMRYISHAQEDAQIYGARHRQMEVSQILPIIEQEYVRLIQVRNQRIYILIGISLLLMLICVVAIVLLLTRNRALSEARRLNEDMNEKLLLANKVKEEYIGSFLCWQSEFITTIEKYQRHVQRAAELRKFDDLLQVPRHADAGYRREDFNRRFDEMFLRIFPTFVDDFNKLLRPGEQIRLHQGELLNTDLRIFALVRLGITHNEVIAEVLNYSVNTIYAYKTKVKGRSDLSTEVFYERILSIGSDTFSIS